MKKGRSIVSKTDRKLLKTFGEKIRIIRESKKLSVYELTGDDMPIKSRQHWQRIESGQKNINLTTFLKIARSLQIEPSKLLNDIK